MGLTEILALALGIPALTLAILSIVFAIVYFAGLRQREQIAKEGVVRRTGTQWIRVRMRGYRGPGIATSSRLSVNIGEILLTERGLRVVGGARMPRFERGHLSRCTTWTREGKLHVATSDPPNATGYVEVSVRVPDADAWLDALRACGARVEAPAA